MGATEHLRGKWLRLALGSGLSGVALYLALRGVDLKQVGETLSGAKAGFILLALVGVALSHLMKVLRWKILLGQPGAEVSALRLLEALTVAQFFNLALPLRIGEISRVILLGRRGLSRSFVLGTIALEKFLDLLIFALMFIILLVLLPLPGWVNQPGIVLLFITACICVLLLAVVTWRSALFSLLDRLSARVTWRWWKRVQGWLNSALSSLDILSSRIAMLQLALVSAGVWSAAIVTNQLVFLALDLDLPVTAALLVMVALQAVFSLPSAPGKLGIFEYICVLSLAVFALDQSGALSYGILLHAIGYLPVIALGFVFLWSLGFSRAWKELL